MAQGLCHDTNAEAAFVLFTSFPALHKAHLLHLLVAGHQRPQHRAAQLRQERMD